MIEKRLTPNFFSRYLLVSAFSLSGVFAQAAEIPAVLDWSGRVQLTLTVSGVLDNVSAQAGQIVKKGEMLASLDPALFKAGVAENRADMDRLSEEHADAKRDLERVQELYARTVASTTELDSAKLRFSRASSGLAAAQARVEKARHLLAESELRAPFDALILVRHADPGLAITSQCQPATVFTVARVDELVARAQLDVAQAVDIHLGSVAEVSVAGVSLKGKVRSLSVNADHRYTLEVTLPRGAGMLAGQPATIRLP